MFASLFSLLVALFSPLSHSAAPAEAHGGIFTVARPQPGEAHGGIFTVVRPGPEEAHGGIFVVKKP
jgi:hypothetical protein